jgi:hypothetical protein
VAASASGLGPPAGRGNFEFKLNLKHSDSEIWVLIVQVVKSLSLRAGARMETRSRRAGPAGGVGGGGPGAGPGVPLAVGESHRGLSTSDSSDDAVRWLRELELQAGITTAARATRTCRPTQSTLVRARSHHAMMIASDSSCRSVVP